jgi:hypothetical protein
MEEASGSAFAKEQEKNQRYVRLSKFRPLSRPREEE